MPDKKLTDNEIRKALEVFVDSIGKDIIFANVDMKIDGTNEFKHIDLSFNDIFDLINHLQAENERLKKFKSYFDFYYGSDIEILGIDENGDTTSFDEFYNCAIANAESIEHHISHIIKTAKAEAYKEFAERLKEKTAYLFSAVSIRNEVDNLLKELVGDK